jgi:hypothetical protein
MMLRRRPPFTWRLDTIQIMELPPAIKDGRRFTVVDTAAPVPYIQATPVVMNPNIAAMPELIRAAA